MAEVRLKQRFPDSVSLSSLSHCVTIAHRKAPFILLLGGMIKTHPPRKRVYCTRDRDAASPERDSCCEHIGFLKDVERAGWFAVITAREVNDNQVDGKLQKLKELAN